MALITSVLVGDPWLGQRTARPESAPSLSTPGAPARQAAVVCAEAMAAPRQLLPLLILSASLAIACGGSSSETPPPLPPLALNEPYRARSAVEPRPVRAPSDAAGDEDSNVSRAAPAPGRTTWGSTAPEPLPELSPK